MKYFIAHVVFFVNISLHFEIVVSDMYAIVLSMIFSKHLLYHILILHNTCVRPCACTKYFVISATRKGIILYKKTSRSNKIFSYQTSFPRKSILKTQTFGMYKHLIRFSLNKYLAITDISTSYYIRIIFRAYIMKKFILNDYIYIDKVIKVVNLYCVNKRK